MLRRLFPALALLATVTGVARAQPPPGTPVVTASVPGLAGGTEELLPAGARAAVIVFLRPGQERSADALAAIAECQERLAGKPVRWLAVVPPDADPAQLTLALGASKARLAVGRDVDERLYGELLLRMHPVVAILEKGRRVSSVVAYQTVGWAEVLTVRVRRALGEATDADVAAALAPARSALPGDGDAMVVAQRNVNFARKLFDQKKYAQARAQVRRALELAPSADAWALQGDLDRVEQRCPDARRAYDAALRLDPRQPEALAGRAACP